MAVVDIRDEYVLFGRTIAFKQFINCTIFVPGRKDDRKAINLIAINHARLARNALETFRTGVVALYYFIVTPAQSKQCLSTANNTRTAARDLLLTTAPERLANNFCSRLFIENVR